MPELKRQYRERPFVDAELWAGKIARVMSRIRKG